MENETVKGQEENMIEFFFFFDVTEYQSASSLSIKN